MQKTTNFIMLLFTIVFSAAFISTRAQQNLTVSLGEIKRATPQFGFNTTAQIPSNFPAKGNLGANWSQQWFIDSVIVLNPEILRFPGGLNSNHWDWQTGWYKPGYQPPGVTLKIRTDEFKPGLMGCKAKGLFVLNLETSNAHYEMEGLRHADSIGLKPSLFELGNEHNLPSSQFPLQTMTPTKYAQLARPYFDSLRAEFPSSRICAVGGNNLNGVGKGWNDSVLVYIPTIDAFAFHVYLTADNADLAFNVNRALAAPYGNSGNKASLGYRYNIGGFGSLPSKKEVWVTEYNLDETQISSKPVIAGTWTHLLYNTAFNDFFLSKPNITMILNHTLAAAATHYESISKVDGHITANGISVKLLSDVARGSDSCRSLAFSGNPKMQYEAASIPKIIGWKFDHSGVEKGFICNFSSDTLKVALAGVYKHPMQFIQYYADSNMVVNGLSSLKKYTGNSTGIILIHPFSITQINSPILSSVPNLQQYAKNDLWVFPNPSGGNLTIRSSKIFMNAEVQIFDLKGEEIMVLKNINGSELSILTTSLNKGAYLIRVFNQNEWVTTKWIYDGM